MAELTDRFADPYVTVVQLDECTWSLREPVVYGDWRVPEGYITDFATVPRLVWGLVPRFGAYTIATVLHDWLITDALPEGRVTSREVDQLFREALDYLGVSAPRRWLMWAGVRWGALFNRRRRGGWGWFNDAPAVLLISLLALPLLLPALVLVPSLLLGALLDLIDAHPVPDSTQVPDAFAPPEETL